MQNVKVLFNNLLPYFISKDNSNHLVDELSITKLSLALFHIVVELQAKSYWGTPEF